MSSFRHDLHVHHSFCAEQAIPRRYERPIADECIHRARDRAGASDFALLVLGRDEFVGRLRGVRVLRGPLVLRHRPIDSPPRESLG